MTGVEHKFEIGSKENSVFLHGDVSDDHLDRIKKTLGALPLSFRLLLQNNDYKIRAGHHVTTILPYLLQKYPDEVNEDGIHTNYDASGGLHTTLTKDICVPEYIWNKGEKRFGKSSPDNVSIAMTHEIGHAIDNIFKLSENPHFIEAYKEDIANYPYRGQDPQKILGNYGKGDTFGQKEAFAELFSQCFFFNAIDNRIRLASYLPRTQELVNQVIHDIQFKYSPQRTLQMSFTEATPSPDAA